MIWPGVIMPRGWPSGAAFATTSLPRMPPAPGLFSTMTGTPSLLCIDSARMRPMISAPPPGPKDTIIRIACCGQSWAGAGLTEVSASNVATTAKRNALTVSPQGNRRLFRQSSFRGASANFSNNHAIVHIGFARAHTGLQHVFVHLQRVQFLSEHHCLTEH